MEEVTAYLPAPRALRASGDGRGGFRKSSSLLQVACEVGWGAAGKVASTGSLLGC